MGLATVSKAEWGYVVTGDTDPTPIWTDGKKYVQGIVYCPGTTNDTMYISTTPTWENAGTRVNVITSASAGVAGVAQSLVRTDGNIPLNNPTIAMSNGSAKCYIYVRSR